MDGALDHEASPARRGDRPPLPACFGDEEPEGRLEVRLGVFGERIAEIPPLAPNREHPRLGRLAGDTAIGREQRRGRHRVRRVRAVPLGLDPGELERRRGAHAGVDENDASTLRQIERVFDLELKIGEQLDGTARDLGRK